MIGLLQILGALAVLTAFVGVQTARLEPSAPIALTLNAAGASVLAALAVHDRLWGFLLLEGVWGLAHAAAKTLPGP